MEFPQWVISGETVNSWQSVWKYKHQDVVFVRGQLPVQALENTLSSIRSAAFTSLQLSVHPLLPLPLCSTLP